MSFEPDMHALCIAVKRFYVPQIYHERTMAADYRDLLELIFDPFQGLTQQVQVGLAAVALHDGDVIILRTYEEQMV